MVELGRLLTALVTPFDGSGRVDYEQAKRLARALLHSGSDGFVVGGTTGEASTLSDEEKLRLFADLKSAVGEEGAIVAGTGNNCTWDSIKLTKQAEEVGVDGVLLTVPYYNKPPQEGLYQHFKAIASSTHLPCILYNIPGRTGLNMAVETTVRLSQIDNIIGGEGGHRGHGSRWPGCWTVPPMGSGSGAATTATPSPYSAWGARGSSASSPTWWANR